MNSKLGGFIRKIDPRGWVELSSPVTLGFALLSLMATLLHALTGGASTRTLFSVYRAPLSDPLFIPRLFLHVLGHADLTHLTANLGLMLVLGPPAEKRWGAVPFLLLILATALVTGLTHIALSPATLSLGASGVVYMLIILSASAGREGGKVPLTLILVAFIYLGQETANGVLRRDMISQLAHVSGGLCGVAFGLLLKKKPQ